MEDWSEKTQSWYLYTGARPIDWFDLKMKPHVPCSTTYRSDPAGYILIKSPRNRTWILCVNLQWKSYLVCEQSKTCVCFTLMDILDLVLTRFDWTLLKGAKNLKNYCIVILDMQEWYLYPSTWNFCLVIITDWLVHQTTFEWKLRGGERKVTKRLGSQGEHSTEC